MNYEEIFKKLNLVNEDYEININLNDVINFIIKQYELSKILPNLIAPTVNSGILLEYKKNKFSLDFRFELSGNLMTVTDNLNCLYHDIINQEIINKYKKIFKMDYKEILKKLEELGISKYDFGSDKDIHIDDLGKIEIVDQAGSYGELQEGAYYMDFYIVRHFVEHDVYIKLDGEYSSYQGVEPGEYSEVKPHEEVRIVYK